MKRILFINNGYPTEELPNYSTYVKTMYQCLLNAGFQVDLLVLRLHNLGSLAKIWAYLKFWWCLLRVRLAPYDILYVNHAPFAFPLFFRKRKYRKKIYIHWHGNELVGKTFFVQNMLRMLKPRVKECCHIAPSCYFKERVKDILEGVDENVKVSPSGGVNTDLFNLEEKSSGRNEFVIGYASSLTMGKGVDILEGVLKSYVYLKKKTSKIISYRVIKYGRDASCFLNLFAKEEIPLSVVDKCPKSLMPNFYHSVDILLMSSKSESLGLVALEAMSCGIPVITYDICAFSEFVISGVSGELVKYTKDKKRDVEEFEKAIIKIIENYDLYAPRKIVLERYSEQTVVDFYKSL